MLKADTNTTTSKPWSKIQALSSIIQLKSNNSRSPASNKNDNQAPFVSHSNTGFYEQKKTQEQQPKEDRLRIFVSTWNMYGRLLDIDLEPILTTRHPSTPSPTLPANPTSQPDSDKILVEHNKQNGESPFLDSSTAQPYHLLAIGTQECERNISEALFYPSKEAWEQKLCEYLGDQYKMVRCETLAALHLAVFVNKRFASYVKNVHSADIKTGWANMVGNKGAVAVSLDFGSQSLLFINCHLRAHQTKLVERNANVHRILHELQIKGGKTVLGPTSSNALFHLPSLKKLTQPSPSIKSTKSMKSVRSTKSTDKEESSAKGKTPKNSNTTATTTSKGNSASNKSENRNITKHIATDYDQSLTKDVTINSVQQHSSDDTNSTAKDNDYAFLDTTKKSSSIPPKPKGSNDKKRKSLSAMSSSSASFTSTPAEEQHSVTEQFDHVFIFGDTNYRINADRQFVLETIKKQDFKTLLKYDQLTLERQQKTTPLADFNEHPIDFIPTYKFDAIDADSIDSSSSSTSSSTSLPMSPITKTVASNSGQQEDHTISTPVPQLSSPASASTSSPASAPAASTATAATAATTSSSSESFVITPKNSSRNSCSVSVRYDTSPKQRIPSWTDRILWHDRHHTHHHHHDQQQGNTISQTNPSSPPGTVPRSVPLTTTTDTMEVTNQSQQLKPKKNLKWITALKRKNKNDLMNGGLHETPQVDKNTICYHYDTVMDPRLMGVSDHLPVIGIFGVWFDEWEYGASNRAKSIKSFKKKIPVWKKWLL